MLPLLLLLLVVRIVRCAPHYDWHRKLFFFEILTQTQTHFTCTSRPEYLQVCINANAPIFHIDRFSVLFHFIDEINQMTGATVPVFLCTNFHCCFTLQISNGVLEANSDQGSEEKVKIKVQKNAMHAPTDTHIYVTYNTCSNVRQ